MDPLKDDAIKPLSVPFVSCNSRTYYGAPKYKKDPEIHVDNEQIGQQPLL